MGRSGCRPGRITWCRSRRCRSCFAAWSWTGSAGSCPSSNCRRRCGRRIGWPRRSGLGLSTITPLPRPALARHRMVARQVPIEHGDGSVPLRSLFSKTPNRPSAAVQPSFCVGSATQELLTPLLGPETGGAWQGRENETPIGSRTKGAARPAALPNDGSRRDAKTQRSEPVGWGWPHRIPENREPSSPKETQRAEKRGGTGAVARASRPWSKWVLGDTRN